MRRAIPPPTGYCTPSVTRPSAFLSTFILDEPTSCRSSPPIKIRRWVAAEANRIHNNDDLRNTFTESYIFAFPKSCIQSTPRATQYFIPRILLWLGKISINQDDRSFLIGENGKIEESINCDDCGMHRRWC